MLRVHFDDWGMINYKKAWDKQQVYFDGISDIKIENRHRTSGKPKIPENHLFFCEHPHVYTLGKNGHKENLLLDEKRMFEKGIDFYKINRGGDITYHGPGQIMGYFIWDLEQLYTDIDKFLRELEGAIILTLAEYGIEGGRIKGLTGVWLDEDSPLKSRKICAMGMRISRWVTMHGFALNVNSDVDLFKNIIPCGIQDKGVTSMQKELCYPVDINEVKLKLKYHIQTIFNIEWEKQKA